MQDTRKKLSSHSNAKLWSEIVTNDSSLMLESLYISNIIYIKADISRFPKILILVEMTKAIHIIYF